MFLESASPLARSLHQEIISLGRRIEAAATVEEELHQANGKSRVADRRDGPTAGIIDSIKSLLERIDREIPLLQLAITASGESLSTSMPSGISPSRLLQASTFLMFGDTQFAQDPSRPVQIGPAFTLSLYMLFLGHAKTVNPAKDASKKGDIDDDIPSQSNGANIAYGLADGDRKPLWQEVLHKARVRLCRTRRNYVFDGFMGYRPEVEESLTSSGASSPSTYPESRIDYTYHLEVIEDLDDGRVHDENDTDEPFDDIKSAGIRESIPIYQISKIFYTDMGRILNIGNAAEGENNPVLLLKRDIGAVRREAERADALARYLEDIDDEEQEEASILKSDEADEQREIEKQMRRESADLHSIHPIASSPDKPAKWCFPSHLDPEWIALEVFEEEEDNSLSETEDEDSVDLNDGDIGHHTNTKARHSRSRWSLDSKVIEQIRSLSLRTSINPSTPRRSPERHRKTTASDISRTQDFMARSPFGAVTTSLSLMEMLIRLTSLQEFQQASHLSIPDHIMTFFLEETSTTGLVGESRWRARSEAKRRMGFDPYNDTPSKNR